MKKEVNYLSLPDYSNKYLLCNYNQKFDSNDFVCLHFKLSDKFHLGSALKALYLLEIIFPKKPTVLKVNLKKKKVFFGQKNNNNKIFFKFNTSLSSLEFVDYFRFFYKIPFKFDVKNNIDFFIINRKFKQFEFKNFFFVKNQISSNSINYFNFYHLN